MLCGQLAALLRTYRRVPVPSWSAVLLETLSPMLVATCVRFPHRPLGIDDEDVQQQVVTEALDAARCIDLPEQPRSGTLTFFHLDIVAHSGHLATVTCPQPGGPKP